MTQKLLNSVIKTGNSIAVVVPATFAKKVGVKPGDKVKVVVNPKKGTITYEFVDMRQLTLV